MTPENAVWIIAAAFGLAIALVISLGMFRRWRKRKAVEAMKEQPWSPEALALLAESLDYVQVPAQQEPAQRTSVTPEAAVEQQEAAVEQQEAAVEQQEAAAEQQEAAAEQQEAAAERNSGNLPRSVQWLLAEIVEKSGRPAGNGPAPSRQVGFDDCAGLEPPEEGHARKELEDLLYQLPIQAGGTEIGRNLKKVALGALRYYRYGLSQDSPDLPVSVTSGAFASPSSDTSIIAGYLQLEQRMGRLPVDLHAAKTASLLLGAVAARALGIGGVQNVPETQFVHAAVNILIEGGLSPSFGGEPPLDETIVPEEATVPGEAPSGGPLRWRAGGLT